MKIWNNFNTNKILFLGFIFFTAPSTFAQQAVPQMADTFRAEGKIYVVVSVLSVVFLCLAAYLVIIDRKLKKLEDQHKK